MKSVMMEQFSDLPIGTRFCILERWSVMPRGRKRFYSTGEEFLKTSRNGAVAADGSEMTARINVEDFVVRIPVSM